MAVVDDGVRLVVTGHDQRGVGVVVCDERVGLWPQAAAGYRSYMLWGTDRLPTYPDDGRGASFVEPLPPPGGVRFTVLVVPPDEDFHRAAQAPESDAAMAGMHVSGGGVHYTATVDLLTVLEGEVWLELDEAAEVHLKAGDCIVQNGTRHAWRNHTNRPARVAVVVVGTDHAGYDGSGDLAG